MNTAAGTQGGASNWLTGMLKLDDHGGVLVAHDPPGSGHRLFGGLIVAQALWAAGVTVGGQKTPHSLHVYFLRGGLCSVEIEYRVECIRDGNSFDTRRVTAVQKGRAILEMMASFHRPEPGVDEYRVAAPTAAFDAAIPTATDFMPGDFVEIRAVGTESSSFADPPFWFRVKPSLEDDPIMRACVLAFVSDCGPMGVARPSGAPLAVPSAGYAASLDHSMWFHRPYRPELWHRYEMEPLNNCDSRGLVSGAIYDPSGALIANVAQEALWRL